MTTFIVGCTQKKASDKQVWELGWRMVENELFNNYQLADLQFDSLRQMMDPVGYNFMEVGLKVKDSLYAKEEVHAILSSLSKSQLELLCLKQFLGEYNICADYKNERIENRKFQIELIKMYINDQYSRGNLEVELLERYNLTREEVIIDSFAMDTDNENRLRLKELIEANGFPTREMVGVDAMEGVFYIIQHADKDIKWQESQLVHIEKAVKAGDLDANSYAYLYDRIKMLQGAKQRFGTQFSKVDSFTKEIVLVPVENLEKLDDIRREIGLMPIDLYKRIMLNVSK